MAGVGLSLGFPKISCCVVPTGGAEVATAPGGGGDVAVRRCRRGGPDGRGCGRRGSAEVRGGPPVTRPCLLDPSISRDPRLTVIFEEGNSFAEIQSAHHTAPPSLCVPHGCLRTFSPPQQEAAPLGHGRPPPSPGKPPTCSLSPRICLFWTVCVLESYTLLPRRNTHVCTWARVRNALSVTAETWKEPRCAECNLQTC